MLGSPEYLSQVQSDIEQCRQLAARTTDPVAAKRLRQLADDLERRARELDLE